MAARVVVLCVAVAFTFSLEGTDPVESEPVEVVAIANASPVSATVAPGPVEPWIHAAMKPRVRERLESGFTIALQRLRDIPSCRQLFSDLGADGAEMLRTTLYFPMPSIREEIKICRDGGADAATIVGAASTFVCRNFERIPDERAAIVVIHEALHHAGLSESPPDRHAPTSREINGMVADRCELSP